MPPAAGNSCSSSPRICLASRAPQRSRWHPPGRSTWLCWPRSPWPGSRRPGTSCSGSPAPTAAIRAQRWPGTGRIITVYADGGQARWTPRAAVVFAGAAGEPSCPSADRSCGYINFFTSARAARAWARRHPEVTGTVMSRQGALHCGIAEFGTLMQAPQPAGPCLGCPGAAAAGVVGGLAGADLGG